MKARITVGNVVFDVTEATPTELMELARATTTGKHNDVVSTTKEAMLYATAPRKRQKNNALFTTQELVTMAKLSIELGPDAKHAPVTIANAMKGQPHNTRKLSALYSIAYNLYHYIKSGRKGNLSKHTRATLAENGFHGNDMKPVTSNFLGETRTLIVQEA